MKTTSNITPASAGSIFRQVFAAWSCFFVCFILPLEFIFQIDAFLNYLTWVHILFNALLVLLLYLGGSGAIALGSQVLFAVLKPFGLAEATRAKWVLWPNFGLIFFGCCYKMLINATVWAKATLHLDFNSSTLSRYYYVISLVAAVLMVVIKPQIAVKFAATTQRTRKPILAALCAALVILTINAVFNLARDAKRKPDASATLPRPAAAARPNVILITLDALTSHDMSLYGYHMPTTPNLEAFARHSYVFNHAYANSTFTTAGTASILTAKYPITSKVYSYFNFLTPAIRHENLAHELQGAGYKTVALVAGTAAHPNHNGIFRDFNEAPLIAHLHPLTSISVIEDFLLALERCGFHPYAWFGERLWSLTQIESAVLRLFPKERARRDQLFTRNPETTLQLAHAYLQKETNPLFLWVHVYAPHSPYLPVEPFKYRFLPEKVFESASSQQIYSHSYYTPEQQPEIDQLRLRYNEHIAWTDAAVGQFLAKLTAEGRLDNTIVIISSDHGEQFEKGYHEHGGAGYIGVYQPLIHIPLIIRLPGQTDGKRLTQNAEQIDIAPTILEILKLPVPDWMEGESLLPGIVHQRSSSKLKFSMNLETCSPRKPIDDGSIAVIQGSDKYIYYRRTGKEELFDLSKDPQEEKNLISSNPEKAKVMNKFALKRLGLE